ncbi:NADP-dependent oxidoreductase [Catenulispora rubra]|uniref:NADP-dependent oxidoreductase n=1 Tax=Catenulispora rubra TaxID=280293 RepID=UPI0018921B96|nr:NADP-dependent oxidoreductase [Catenulispora rubra]
MTEQSMRAIVATKPGPADVLKETRVPKPQPGGTEILVRVHAAAINPADWKTRASGGWAGRHDVTEQGPILGWDVSGVVEAVGRGVTLFQPGDEVFGMPLFPHFPGGYSEYVAAPARQFVGKPADLTHVQAAALPLAALTAYQALHDFADVQPGQRVLIHAAAGGVGHLAVQIAKALGANVVGTASAAKHDLLRELGADEVVDYREVDFAETVTGVDVVVDAIGGDYFDRSLRTMNPGGTFVALSYDVTPAMKARAAERDVTADFMLVEPDLGGLTAIRALVTEGRLRPVVDTVLPLADAAKAHELGETNRVAGKIVLTVVED